VRVIRRAESPVVASIISEYMRGGSFPAGTRTGGGAGAHVASPHIFVGGNGGGGTGSNPGHIPTPPDPYNPGGETPGDPHIPAVPLPAGIWLLIVPLAWLGRLAARKTWAL
jgi:hypothetical protein